MKQTLMCLVSVLCFLVPGMSMAQEERQNLGIAREHYYQGRFYAEQGKLVEAIFELEKAVELHPHYTEAYNALGVIYHRQKNLHKARQYYQLAVETNPRDAKARTNLAMVYHERQEFAKARQQLEKALEYDPDYVLAHKLIERLGPEVEEQETPPPQKKELQPTPPPASKPPASSGPPISRKTTKRQARQRAQKVRELFEQGTLLVTEGRVDAGIRAYQQALHLAPRSVEGHTLLAMAYRQKFHATGDDVWRQKEISAFQRALSLQATYVPALLGLGETYYDQGKIGEAISLFEAVLQKAPNHPAKDQIQAIIGLIP